MRHTLLQRGLLGMVMGGLLAGTAQARTLETAYGDVEVADNPVRVVTLYEGALDAALAAGVTPVGAVTTRGGDNVAQYVTDYLNAHELAHPEIVGVVREINIEAVLAQQPDLILAAAQLPEEQYQLLSQIAPHRGTSHTATGSR